MTKPIHKGMSKGGSSLERVRVRGGPGALLKLVSLVKLLIVCCAIQPQLVPACSVPVFRYALERWLAAPYELLVLSEGQLDDRGQALLSRLSGPAASANLTVRTLDLRAAPTADLMGGLAIPPPGSLPACVLLYPEQAGHREVVWSGPFSESKLAELLDSPLRRRIVQRLSQGDSAVWILLESGDSQRDNAAATLLQTRLEHHQRTITLPEAESGGETEGWTGPKELKVVFAMMRLARDDPSEELLVRLLLGSEDDLKETREAMAFPIYGRGRLLYALVGKGINPETIGEACAFLTGPCSCVIKDQNPGLDLLLLADWDGCRRPPGAPGPEVPDLIGRQGHSALSGSGSTTRGRKIEPIRLDRPARLYASGVLKRSLILTGALSALVLTIGACIFLRKPD
jgi:hypothetical protein